jgi:hypothetical protein
MKTHSYKDLNQLQREPVGENRPVPALGKPVEVIPIEEFIEMYIGTLKPIEKAILEQIINGNRLCILPAMRSGKTKLLRLRAAMLSGKIFKISPEDLKNMVEKG